MARIGKFMSIILYGKQNNTDYRMIFQSVLDLYCAVLVCKIMAASAPTSRSVVLYVLKINNSNS